MKKNHGRTHAFAMTIGITFIGGITMVKKLFSTTLFIIVLAGCTSTSINKQNIDRFVSGYVDTGFEEVKAEFEKNFYERGENGAALCIYYKGKKVVDLWGGYRIKSEGELWEEDTCVNAWSATKGLAAMTLAMLNSDGYLDYEEKVSTYWPEFAVNGKQDITVRQLISHQAGLITLGKNIEVKDLKDFAYLEELLANSIPTWNPGDYHGYHSATMGNFMGVLVTKCDPKHRTLGQYFAEEIAKPLNLEFYIGLPESFPDDRLSEMIPINPLGALFNLDKMDSGLKQAFFDRNSLFNKSMYIITDYDPTSRKTLEVEQPSGNGVGTARSIALAYSVFAMGGMELGIKKDTVDNFLSRSMPPKYGTLDKVLNVQTEYGLGISPFTINNGITIYGFYGAVSSFGFADPVNQIGFGYTPNKMDYCGGMNDPREVSIRTALYKCIREIEETRDQENQVVGDE
ncbi:MAG: beta-lactamase family protein [Spirochaetes bacterium]|nr:beta-lactamase family protein [Spirochaetota bacterium]MBU0956774.1 beta-lactamase family protein [Spirochaetota bacterium]